MTGSGTPVQPLSKFVQFYKIIGDKTDANIDLVKVRKFFSEHRDGFGRDNLNKIFQQLLGGTQKFKQTIKLHNYP